MNIDEIKISKATSRDIGRIVEIEESSYKDPWPREVFMVDYLFNNSAEYFVAKVKSKIVSFIGIWIEEAELHIINLAVDPENRRNGCGRFMLSFAIDLAKRRRIKQVYLEARKSNDIAQKLYFSCGFEPIEELKEYYQDGEDGIRMSKIISMDEEPNI